MPQKKKPARAGRRKKKTLIEVAAKLIGSHAFRVKVANNPVKALRDFGLDSKQVSLLSQIEKRGPLAVVDSLRHEFAATVDLIRESNPGNYIPPAELRDVAAGRAAGQFLLRGRGLKSNMRVRIARRGGPAIVVAASRRTVGADMFDRVTVRRRLAPGRYTVSVETRKGEFSNGVPLTVE